MDGTEVVWARIRVLEHVFQRCTASPAKRVAGANYSRAVHW